MNSKLKKNKDKDFTEPVLSIEKYGCDAVRFTLASMCTYGGQDIKLSDEKFEFGRNFANKIWNASRFVLMNLENKDFELDLNNLSIADKWILNKLNKATYEIVENLENYRMGEVTNILYDFFWNSFCDWYVELSKIEKNESVLTFVLDRFLRLLHPFMPHLTEQIWQLIPIKKETPAIMLSSYPKYDEKFNFEEDSNAMELVFEAIRSIRNIRSSFNIAPSIKVNLKIQGEKELYKKVESYLKRLARAENIEYVENAGVKQSASTVVGNSKIIIPLAGLIDIKEEIQRQNKKLLKLNTEKESLSQRMMNEKFVKSAPLEVVQKTKARIEELSSEIKVIEGLIKSLS